MLAFRITCNTMAAILLGSKFNHQRIIPPKAKSYRVFKKRVWYKEVIIICLIIPFASIAVTLLVGLPRSVLYYLPLLAGLPLLIIVMIWRVRKRAISLKEATVLIFLYTGLNYAVNIFVPWPSSFLVSFGLVLTIIWRVHERAVN